MVTDGRRGSVKQAANGTWGFVVDVGRDGERKQTRRRSIAAKREAQRQLTELLGSHADGVYVAPVRQSLAAFLTDTWLPGIEHTVKPGTFQSYRRNLRLHVSSRPIGRRQLQKLHPGELNALYALLLAGDADHRPLSPRTVIYVGTILH